MAVRMCGAQDKSRRKCQWSKCSTKKLWTICCLKLLLAQRSHEAERSELEQTLHWSANVLILFIGCCCSLCSLGTSLQPHWPKQKVSPDWNSSSVNTITTSGAQHEQLCSQGSKVKHTHTSSDQVSVCAVHHGPTWRKKPDQNVLHTASLTSSIRQQVHS